MLSRKEFEFMNAKMKIKYAFIGITMGGIIVGIIIFGILSKEISQLESELQTEKAVSSELREDLYEIASQEKVEITTVQVWEKLHEIDELSTYMKEYTGQTDPISSTKGVPLFDGLTENTVEITYSGVIKVGYEVGDIQVEVNSDKEIIFITLPEPKILDNYIILDNTLFEEKNNWFNPINVTDVNTYLVQIEEAELGKAIENGIFVEAEKSMKSIVTNFLAVFADYEVVFVD